MDQVAANSPQSEGRFRAVQDVLKAAHFAAESHSGRRRKGAAAEPYINHLIEVAELVSSALSEPDTNLVIAALLHDTIGDAGAHSPSSDSIDTVTLELLETWRLQDATDDPEELRAAEQELTEFKKTMNENRTLAGEPLLCP